MKSRRSRRVSLNVALLATLAAVWVTGCQTAGPKAGPLLLFPPPPDEPKVMFLTWASGARQVDTSGPSLDQFLLGDEAIDRRRLNKPYGIAALNGSVYVVDTKGQCVAHLNFREGRFTLLGAHGPGQLRKPLNIAVDPAGFKFVVDVILKKVVVYGPDDAYVTAYDVPEPCRPVDISVFEDELYVLDNDDTPQVVVLDRKTGEVRRSFGSEGRDEGQFHYPGSLAVSPDGHVYVSDTLNWRFQKFTRDGEPVWAKGNPGYRLGQFGRPRGIRVGPDNIVYLVDGATELVQMFNPDGELLMHFGGPGNTPGAMLLPSSLAIDRTSIPYFKKYAHKAFNIDYLLFVVNQYGPHLVNVYAYGGFPDGYKFGMTQVGEIPDAGLDEGIGAVEGEVPPLEPAEEEKPSGHPPTDGPG